MNLLNRLKLGQKLALVLLMLLVPITYLTWQDVARLQTQMRNDALGLQGLEYLSGLEKAIVPVTRHEAATTAALLGGDDQGKPTTIAQSADAAFAEFRAARARYPISPEAARIADKLAGDWQVLRDHWLEQLPDQLHGRYAALTGDLNLLIEVLGAEHMLNRGMDNTLMYVKTAVTQQLPDLQIALGDLRYGAVKLAATYQPVTGADLAASGAARGRMEAVYERIDRTLAVASAHPTLGADFKALAAGPAAAGRRAFADFDRWLDGTMAPGRAVPFRTVDVFEKGRPVADAVDALNEGLKKSLSTALEQRYAESRRQRNVGIAIVATLLAAALALGAVIARGITRSMRQAVGVFGRIQQGEFDNAVEARGVDEVAQVLRGLAEMQGKLKERIERDRAVAAENGRVRTALDKVTTNVMLADADGRIIYMNEAVSAMFRHNAPEIRKQLPSFDPDTILGSNFDVFHRDASHQRRLLAGLTGTHTSEMKLGGATLRIVANPVVDAEGRRLGTAVQWFDRTQEVATEEEVAAVVGAAVAGDLSRRIVREGKTGFFATLAEGMNGLLDNVSGVIRTIKGAAAEVKLGAEEISKGNANLSQRTEEQASSLEETASSMEEMTSTVKQNADNAQQANQLANAARGEAEKGGEVVAQAVTAMQEIEAASKKIADIIGVIDEIAFQTNLLALNAAVEAARAGEQGRGFAVVASEVRNLASRSAAAAKEIKTLIQDSVAKVGEGSRLVDRSGKTLTGIVVSVKKVTDIVAEIAAASTEQSAGIEQVNKAVMSMDEVTQQNAALVEEAAAAAEALKQQAEELADLMAKYRTGDEPAAGPAPAPRAGAAPRGPAVPVGGPVPAARPAGRPAAAVPRPAPPRPRAVGPARAAAADAAEWSEF
jgi:methyl-accepting chemotaxis protein